MDMTWCCFVWDEIEKQVPDEDEMQVIFRSVSGKDMYSEAWQRFKDGQKQKARIMIGHLICDERTSLEKKRKEAP